MTRSRLLFGLCALLCTLCLASCGNASVPTTPKKQWTLMMYLDGDEQAMQEDFLAAFAEMIHLQVGSDDAVNVVIQFDRLPTVDDYGGWTIAHRFVQTPGMEPTPENAIADWGDGMGGREVDMSDPDTLSSFVAWAAARYPAENYALLVGDHGYGWQGLIIDMTSYGDFMPVKDLRRSLMDAGVQIDLLALDACLMQMVEVMYEIRDAPVDIVVGSENAGTSWPLAKIIQSLTADPGMSAETLGQTINDLYVAAHGADPEVTLSTVRLGKAGDASLAVRDLAEALLASEPLAALQTRAQEVLDVLDEAIVYARNGSSWSSTRGLSIYFPLPDQGYMPTTYFYEYIDEVTSFADDMLWRDVLFVYYNYMDYPDVLNDAFRHVRGGMSAFDGTNVDLYDFCKRLVDYTE